jgi:pimeloyl-ACP methyl ester carboxylesterase
MVCRVAITDKSTVMPTLMERVIPMPSLTDLERYHGDKTSAALATWFDIWLSSEFADWEIESLAPEIRCPRLGIYGLQDEYGSALHPARYAALTSDKHRLILLNNYKHVPHREHPECVIAAIAGFVEGLG